ncbi:MAG: response regulator [Lewinellaceae bacterium]|nr:response regulator [Lewinellaceae bacterium]
MKLLTPLLWLTGIIIAPAQDYLFDTEVINVENGLPHRNTYGIVQDAAGFIWVSTLRGISRYDGYRFKTYDRSLLNIPEDFAASYLAIDGENRIWYSGKNKPNRPYSGLIDPRRDSIYVMEAISGSRFTSGDVIYVGNSNVNKDHIIIATIDGVIYNYDGDFHEIYRASRPFPDNVLCQALPDGSYWVIHTSYSKTSQNEIFRVKNGKILQQLKVDHWIKRMVASYPELVLEIPYAPTTDYWKPENDRLVPFSVKRDSPEDVVALLQLHQDYSCYLTGSELLVQDKQGNSIYSFDRFKFLDRKFEGCNNTLSDRQGILWITTGNGIIKLSARKNLFKNLGITNNIRGIYREGAQLWTGNIITDLEHGTQTTIPIRNSEGINSFYKDRQRQLWIASDKNFIMRYIPGENRYSYYYYNYEGYEGIVFFNLVFQNALTKTYWLGAKDGLFRFDPNAEKITPFPLPIASERIYVRHFYQNAKGIWITTDKGIFLMDARNEVIIKHYTTKDGLASNDINYLYEDRKGIFWIGTKDSGLLRWDLTTNSFRQYSRDNGLSNDNIYAVYEDDFNTLWLPSDHGLMAFDKNAETAKVYLPEHGIAHEEFNTFSHFQDTDGTLYFGGLKGLTSFHPRDLQEQSTISPPLYATRVQILEKDSETYTDKTTAFKTAKKIVFNPNDRILELELTALDYEKSAENQYAYKLTGKQDQWIYTRENKLSIINPPYGKYDLVIKARGASGSWSENPLVIPMHVKTPFYMQWWFILASGLLAIAVILISLRWRVRKLQKDRQRLEAEVQKRTWKIEQDKITIEAQAEALKALDKAKTRFFSNITHEFRTPLTLVRGPVEQMIAQPPPPATLKKRLSGVLKNTDNLLELINQLLDMSKLESGRMRIEASQGDIVRYTGKLVARFQPLADTKKIQLDFTAHAGTWKTHFDSDKWIKILYNLISNALKFTPAGGRVTVDLEQLQQAHQDYIQLTVKDSGIGIEAGQLEHIFDRFYQVDASATRFQGGTGIGLSLVKELVELQNGTVAVSSTVGEGTAFTVMLPVLLAPTETNGIPAPEEAEVVPPFMAFPDTPTENGRGILKDQNKAEKLELLIVEDHPDMRAYIRSCINASVYNITEAGDGQEGIEKAREIIPDLIISDVMMPKKDGFALTRAIRDHLATSHIPLILLTARASLESRLKGLERGADAYLTKPFSPQELALRIQKLIELRKALRERFQNGQAPEENAAFQKEDRFISALKDYILENISNPDLPAEAIGKHLGISRIQLYRKLKALKNMSVRDYVRSIRLDVAWRLLKEQKLNISEVAYETGFSSPADFSRAFKKAYGKAPSKI